MRPWTLIHLYRVRLRARLGAELLALIGIAVGVALLFAALVANVSLTESVRRLSDGIVGKADFQLSARAASGFDQRVLRRVEAVPGALALPIVEARVNLVGSRGARPALLVGADPQHGGAGGELGGALFRAAEPALSQARAGLVLPAPLAAELGLGKNDRATVETESGTVRIRLAGELSASQLGGLASSPVGVLPLPLLQHLARLEGRISRIFVGAPAGDRLRVEAALKRIAADRLNLAPADQEVTLFEAAAAPTGDSIALFSVLSAVVGFLFAFNAVLLTVPGRRRLIAELRMTGFSPGAILAVVLLDALALGGAGVAVGYLLGAAASALLFDSVPGYLTSAFAIGPQQVVTWQSVAFAAAAGILAACAAILLPLRDSLRAPGAAAETGPKRAAGRRRVEAAAGAVLLASGVAIALFVPAGSLLAVGALLLALLLLLGPWLRIAVVAFGAMSRRLRSVTGILASLQLRSATARTATLALTATGAVAVFATIAIVAARADLQRGLDRISVDVDRGAEVWVVFPGAANIFATNSIALPPRSQRAIEALPEVRAVSRNRGAFLDVGPNRVWVLSPARARIGAVVGRQLVEGEPTRAIRDLRRGGWVTLSEGLASELGVGVGDRVALPLPAPLPLRVAALTNNFGWAGGAIVIDAPTYARGWGSDRISTLGIELRAGASPVSAAAAVRAILGRHRAVAVETTGARGERQRRMARSGLARLGQIAALVLIASLLAMVASMAALVWQRRPTFAALKVQGFGQAELWRALLLESALLLGAGCGLGAAFGLIGQLLLDRALTAITGFPVVYQAGGAIAAAVCAAITGAAVTVLALPGWLAVRVPPRVGLTDL